MARDADRDRGGRLLREPALELGLDHAGDPGRDGARHCLCDEADPAGRAYRRHGFRLHLGRDVYRRREDRGESTRGTAARPRHRGAGDGLVQPRERQRGRTDRRPVGRGRRARARPALIGRRRVRVLHQLARPRSGSRRWKQSSESRSLRQIMRSLGTASGWRATRRRCRASGVSCVSREQADLSPRAGRDRAVRSDQACGAGAARVEASSGLRFQRRPGTSMATRSR